MLIFLGALSEVDRDFMNNLFKRTNSLLYHVAYQMLGVSCDAEDAVYGTYYKVMQHIGKVMQLEEERQKAYCVAIVKNEAISFLRKRNRFVLMAENSGGYLDRQETDLEEEYIKIESRECLQECIRELSRDERQFIFLRFVQELKLAEVAALMGISEEAAKKRNQRILQKLHSLYERRRNNEC